MKYIYIAFVSIKDEYNYDCNVCYNRRRCKGNIVNKVPKLNNVSKITYELRMDITDRVLFPDKCVSTKKYARAMHKQLWATLQKGKWMKKEKVWEWGRIWKFIKSYHISYHMISYHKLIYSWWRIQPGKKANEWRKRKHESEEEYGFEAKAIEWGNSSITQGLFPRLCGIPVEFKRDLS